MEPDKAKDRKSHSQRDGHDVAYFTREFGRSMQRRVLQQPMDPSGSSASTVAHGEDSSFDVLSHPPRHDRAG